MGGKAQRCAQPETTFQKRGKVRRVDGDLLTGRLGELSEGLAALGLGARVPQTSASQGRRHQDHRGLCDRRIERLRRET